MLAVNKNAFLPCMNVTTKTLKTWRIETRVKYLHQIFHNSLLWKKHYYVKYTLPRKNMKLPYSIRMHWTNFCQPTVHVQQNIFEKNYYRTLYSSSLRFFWYILSPNWSIIRGTVSLWIMVENREIAVIEGKCRRFRNSSKCLKTHCAAHNWPIWTQKVPKEA